MPRSDLFAFVDCTSIVLFVRNNDLGSINSNLALTLRLSVIRSQQRMFPSSHRIILLGEVLSEAADMLEQLLSNTGKNFTEQGQSEMSTKLRQAVWWL